MDRTRVVVGTDGSPASAAALDWAAAEAARRDVALTVLHAVHPSELGFGAVTWPIARAWAEEAGRAVVDDALVRARRAGLTLIEGLTTADSPARGLVDLSATAALLVVGHRGRGPVADVLLGSVALAAAAHAHCPVVVVRGIAEPPGPGRPVLVGTDGTEEATAAVRYAADLAAAHGSALVVTAAWRSLVEDPFEPPPPSGTPGAVDLDRRARAEAETWAEDAARLATGLYPALHVTRLSVPGHPDRVLADVADKEDAGLVVLGSPGRHVPTLALAVGSTVHTLLRTAPCPVLVMPGD